MQHREPQACYIPILIWMEISHNSAVIVEAPKGKSLIHYLLV